MEAGHQARLRTLRRDTEQRHARRRLRRPGPLLRVDPLILRVAFVAAATAGIGIPAYLVAWAVLPAEEGDAPVARLRSGPR